MRYSKIKDNDIVNGKGIMMSLWTQGCPHHCKGCFNPETWGFNGGMEFTEEQENYILDNINAFNVSRNLSILGGEPLCPQNVEGVISLCKKFRERYPDKTIYIWTGYTLEDFNETQKEVLKYIDVLVDGQFKMDLKNLSLKLRGSSNQRVIDVKSTIANKEIITFVVD